MVSRRSLLKGAAALAAFPLAAKAVLGTEAVEMAVLSAPPSPTATNGIVTIATLTREFLRLLLANGVVGTDHPRSANVGQSYVDMRIGYADLLLPFDDLSRQFLRPAAEALASKLRRSGRSVVADEWAPPIGVLLWSQARWANVSVRGAQDYDVYYDSIVARFDVRHV